MGDDRRKSVGEVLGEIDSGGGVPLGRHPASLGVEELLKGCVVEKGRSSGPGGQHRNKVSTHVTVTHTATGLSGQAGERRSAARNQSVAVTRLRLAMATGLRTPVPCGEIGSALWRSRVKKGRIACAESHEDFPAMLAEALDVVAASGWDHTKAAVRLGCSATQLVKLIAKHAPALELVNREREKRGLRALKR